MKHLEIFFEVSFGFIFNIRVNPDIPDGNRQESSPREGKIVIPNGNFGINKI